MFCVKACPERAIIEVRCAWMRTTIVPSVLVAPGVPDPLFVRVRSSAEALDVEIEAIDASEFVVNDQRVLLVSSKIS